MLKNIKDKIALSGISVLMIGIVLLIFTFVSAFGFLTAGLTIITSQDLTRTFGEALAPLIATCIRVMYLGIMGWVGSLITIRGVTIIAHAPQPQPTPPQKPQAMEQKVQPKPQPQPQAQPQKLKVEKPMEEKPKEEKPKELPKPSEVPKPPEPEIVVIPPEEVAPAQPQSPQNPQEREAPPPPAPST
jgi:cytoskeletal protein RodZ